MIGPAAFVADQAGDPLPLELGDERRCQFVRDQDDRSIDVPEEIGGFSGRAEVAAEARDDVGDVTLALAEIRIVAAVEERRNLLQGLLQRRLRVHALARNDLRGAIDEHPVIQHEELGVEQIAVFRPRRRRRGGP